MSPSSSRPLPAEALLAHRQWVRELALRLVQDPSAAEDLEQQTWLSALRSPPEGGGSPKAWLGTVLRHWLSKMRRGQERRTRREHRAARGEPVPSTAEIVAEADAHRRVVEAVFALEEPLKTTVLLRFFEELPLAEVAARTGVPPETARSRIKRALVLLRTTLDRNHNGDRSAWVQALMPLLRTGAGHAVAAAAAPLILEALIMGTKQKLLAVAALLLGGATVTWVLSDRRFPTPEDPGTSIGVPATAPEAAATRTAQAPPDAATRRVAGVLPAGTAPPVMVQVRTWSDQPIADASVGVHAAPAAGPLARHEYDRPEPALVAEARTDATGSVTFTGLAAGRWHFLARKDGFCRAGVPDVVLRETVSPEPVVIRLGAAHTLQGRVLRPDGRAIPGATVVAVPTSSSLVRPRTTSDADGRYTLTELTAGPTYVAAGLPGGTVSPLETIQVPDITGLDLVLRTGGILTGKVTEQGTGRPVAGARVQVRTSQAGAYRPTSADALSDAQGRYVIDTLGEGLVNEMTATKAGWIQVHDLTAGNFDTTIPFRDGGTWTRDLVLGRGGRLVVTVQGPDGPVAGATVAAHCAGRSHLPPSPVTTDEGGRGVFAALEPGRVLVGAWSNDLLQPEFPAQYWEVLGDPTARHRWLVDVADGREASLTITMTPAVAVTGRVLGPDDQGLAGVAVNRANAVSAAAAMVTAADGSFRLTGLEPGANVPLILTKAGWVAAEPCMAKVPPAGTTGELVLRMAAAPHVRGTVHARGAPLGEAYVQVSIVPDGEQEWQEEFRWDNTPRAPLASDGTYDVALSRAGGRFAVRAVTARRPTVTSAPVAMVNGQAEYRIDLELEAGGSLAGRVVALGGSETVPKARVRATWLAPGVDHRRRMRGPEIAPVVAIGDDTGRFVAARLRPGRYELSVTAEGFLEERVEASVPQSGELVVPLPRELTLEGFVHHADGRPVAAAQISPLPEAGNRDMSSSIEQITFSGPDGRFKIPRLQAGQYRIRVAPPRTGQANFRRKDSGIVAAGARDVRITVEAGATIAGVVVDGDGRGLPGLDVAAQKGGTRQSAASAETLQDGTFNLVGLEAGTEYTLVVNASNWGGRNPFASLKRPGVPAGTTGVQFVLEPGLSIDGVVADAQGKPVPGIELTAIAAGADAWSGPVAWPDPSGRFTIRGLKPGRYRLAVAPWFGRGLLVTGGEDVAAGTTGVALTAAEGERIAGIIVDEAAAPLAGVNVDIVAKEGGIGGNWTRSRADGTFEVSGLPGRALYDVSARVPGRVPATQRGVAAGSTGVRLMLATGLGVQGRLVDAAGRPLPGTNLCFVHQGTGARVQTRTDAEGRFSTTGLVPGTHAVEAWLGSAEALVTRSCGTVEAGHRDVEIKVPER